MGLRKLWWAWFLGACISSSAAAQSQTFAEEVLANWLPAYAPVNQYNVYITPLDGSPIYLATTPIGGLSYRVNWDYNDPFRISVRSLRIVEETEWEVSEPSRVWTICPDFTGADDIVGARDYGVFVSGPVTIATYGCFVRVFGKRLVRGEYL